MGPTEAFLALVRQQVYARDAKQDNFYDLETDARTPVDGLLDTAALLDLASTFVV